MPKEGWDHYMFDYLAEIIISPMGSDLNQWRYSIGMFNLKSVRVNCARERSDKISEHFLPENIFSSYTYLPFKLIFGLIITFSYSLMIISCLSICIIAYPLLDFLYLITQGLARQFISFP